MTTQLKMTLSDTLQGTLNQQGVFAYAVYFDSAGNSPTWTTLVDGTTTTPVVNGSTTIDLPDSFSGGKVYFLIQSQTAGSTANLPTLITTESQISFTDPTTGAQALDYRYDSFEVTLSGAAADAGNLTDVIGFGLPMSITVAYPNGTTTQTRGYNVDGSSVFSAIEGISSQLVYQYTEGPLQGKNQVGLSPVTALTSGLPGASSSDWVPYVESLGVSGASDIQIAGYFNGAPSVDWMVYNGTNTSYLEYHNSGFYSYTVSYTQDPNALSGTYTLTPTANSQIQGVINISTADLANSIYATLGNATVSSTSGTEYQFSSLDSGGQVQINSDMNTGTNNQWGATFVKLLTGFIGGYLGGTALPLNSALGTTSTIDLSKNWNFDPTFAFSGTASSGQPGAVTPWTIGSQYGTGVSYDKFAEIFFDQTNSYGNGYSDALTSLFAQGGPLIPVGYIVSSGPPLQQADVPLIEIGLYDDNEPNPSTSQGYTPTVIYNTNAGPYVAPLDSTGAPNLSLMLGFGLGQMRLDPNATVQIGFYTGTTGGLAQFDYVTIPSSSTESLFQTWVFSATGGTGGTPTFTAGGAPAPTGSLIQLNGMPYDTGTNWYQIVVSNGSASRTYNLYADAVAGTGVLNPYYNTGGVDQAGSIAIDGLASIPTGTSDQYWTSLNVAAFAGGTLSMDPALLELITDPTIIANNSGVWLTPEAPALGTLSGSTFSNWGGSTNLTTPNSTAALADVTNGSLAFAWYGADQSWVGYNASQSTPIQVIQSYTNKVSGLDTALISFSSASGFTAHTAISVATDIDGKWVTAAGQFGNGTYSATMAEYLATDTSFTTPVAVTSQALQFTVDLDTLGITGAGSDFIGLDQGVSGTTGNWIRLETTNSTLPNGTLLAYLTDANGDLIGRDGQTGPGVGLADAVVARVGSVSTDGGAVLFEGAQSVYLPVGQQLHFAIEAGNNFIEPLPGVQVTGAGSLAVQVSGSYGSLNLTAFVDNTLSSNAALAASQRAADQAWVYLTQGSNVQVEVAGSAWNVNTVHFVRIDVDAATGDWSVGGVAYGNTDAFRAAVQSNWDLGFAAQGGRGNFQMSDDWTVSKGTGFYAPALATEGGDIFVIGTANADGTGHIRSFGENVFGFEDLRADQSSDFDYNDMIVKLTVA